MRLPLLLIAMTTVASAGVARADPVGTAVDALMREYAGNVAGASVLVVRDGIPVVRRSYGMADLENGIAASPASNYRLASLTKQFTAAAIMLLVEEGRLTLEDSARRWLPTLPPVADSITLRHLLTHTSGLVDYEDVMSADTVVQLRDADVLHLLESHPETYFQPGTGYRYSNSGYALLALIVERASAKRFPDFLKQRIFQPLGMMHTLAYVAEGPAISNRAYGYTGAGTSWQRTDQSPTSAVLGDGGIYSSIDDLAKWDAALDDDRLLGDQSRALMFAPLVATDDPQVRYGLGWRLTAATQWHSGETIGFRNVIVRQPLQRMTVIVLTNRNDPAPYAMAQAIAVLVREHAE